MGHDQRALELTAGQHPSLIGSAPNSGRSSELGLARHSPIDSCQRYQPDEMISPFRDRKSKSCLGEILLSGNQECAKMFLCNAFHEGCMFILVNKCKSVLHKNEPSHYGLCTTENCFLPTLSKPNI